MVIVEVALGLVLIYAVLALLVTKVQEGLFGDFLRRRTSNLHKLMLEAAGQDPSLRDKLFANSLIFSLSKGDVATTGWLRDSGPSAIPPALFAKALLAELNGGEPPATQFATPAVFVGERFSDKQYVRAWQSARALLSGAESSWTVYETAIAQWFSDIWDRSSGWYQRESTWWALLVSFVLAAGLNIDSFHIAQSLSTDPELRRGLADLAEDVNRLREDPSLNPAKPVAQAQAQGPATRTSAALATAITRLNDAFARDDEIAKFGFNMYPVAESCAYLGRWTASPPVTGKTAPAGLTTRQLTNSDTWLHVLPAVLAQVESMQVDPLPSARTAPEPPTKSASGKAKPGQDTAQTQDRCTADKRCAPLRQTVLEDAYRCLVQTSVWVRTAGTASQKPDTIRQMQDAAVALEQGKAGLLEMIGDQRVSLSMSRLFQRDPEAFNECAALGSGRALFESCIARADAATSRLPIFFTDRNWHMQFCTVVSGDKIREATSSGRCAGRSATDAAARALGIPQLALAEKPWHRALLPWLGGVWITALFASLGSTFWFDTLGKLVQLRATGRTRKVGDDAAAALGNKPAAPGPAAQGAASGSAAPTAAGGGEPFSDARNEFERGLLPKEVVRVQQALGVRPENGRLDGPTRSAIKAFSAANNAAATEELSNALYQQITGRVPESRPVQPSTTRLVLSRSSAFVPALATRLEAALGFTGRLKQPLDSIFNDEVRALAVLYRYKRFDPLAAPPDKEAAKLAKTNPAALNEVDEALQLDILTPPAGLPPLGRNAAAPWLDWALGELGQTERDGRSRETSNARIVEYIDTAETGRGVDGDHTAWCGAFVAWVIKRYLAEAAAFNAALPAGASAWPALPAPPASPLLAASWGAWGKAATLSTPRVAADFPAGAVLLCKFDGASDVNHVGFCLGAAGAQVWVLGGNQAGGSRVCISTLAFSQVAAVQLP